MQNTHTGSTSTSFLRMPIDSRAWRNSPNASLCMPWVRFSKTLVRSLSSVKSANCIASCLYLASSASCTCLRDQQLTPAYADNVPHWNILYLTVLVKKRVNRIKRYALQNSHLYPNKSLHETCRKSETSLEGIGSEIGASFSPFPSSGSRKTRPFPPDHRCAQTVFHWGRAVFWIHALQSSTHPSGLNSKFEHFSISIKHLCLAKSYSNLVALSRSSRRRLCFW